MLALYTDRLTPIQTMIDILNPESLPITYKSPQEMQRNARDKLTNKIKDFSITYVHKNNLPDRGFLYNAGDKKILDSVQTTNQELQAVDERSKRRREETERLQPLARFFLEIRYRKS